MAKKEENIESCSCWCKSWERVLGVSLSVLCVIIAIITCLLACWALLFAQRSYEVSKASYDFNVLSAGWIDNFNRMSTVYASEAYVQYATENAEQAESYFGLSENSGEDSIDVDDSNENAYNFDVVAWWDEIKTVVENLLAANPARGDANARFTIVEYTELLCPYCQRHSQAGTINSTIEQFPGEINSISKSFIIHWEEAVKLSAAMECVAELNPSVYHQVFEKAFESYPVDMDTLINIATELGTNNADLQKCVDEWRYVQAVEDGMNQGNELFGVNGTPGNVIIDRETGNYVLVSGAYPLDAFIEAVNTLKNA